MPMNPFDHSIVLILLAAAVVAAGCFIVAWLDIAIHRGHESLPTQQEMRRHMLCGFYCNPEDPRPVVHRPMGWGWTLNMRREQLVLTLIVMTVLAMLAGVLIALVPGQ